MSLQKKRRERKISTFSTIQVDNRCKDLLKPCKMVFLTYHPHFEEHHISHNKIIFEALKYYLKTEPKFRYIVEELEAEEYEK
jgi:hypothetical protein